MDYFQLQKKTFKPISDKRIDFLNIPKTTNQDWKEIMEDTKTMKKHLYI